MKWLFKIELLIKGLDKQDYHGNTPLHIAVENDAYEAIDYLLSV